MMIITQTERLTLRPVEESDAKALLEVFGDPEVMQFGDGPQTIDWVRSWIEETRQDYDLRGFGSWVLALRDRPEAIGYCGLTWFPDINGVPETEIGYRLARDHWNRGFGTEAAMTVRDLAVKQFALSRLIALIDPDNSRSLRVAEKLGMTHDGSALLEGYSHPDLVYACRRSGTAD